MCAVKITARKTAWARRYGTALRKHLHEGPGTTLQAALALGRQAAALGWETLDVARIHEQALLASVPTRKSGGIELRTIERAKRFFIEAIVPIEKTHSAALMADIRISRMGRTLSRRIAESSVSNRRLRQTIVRRQSAETALKKSGVQHAGLLVESRRLQKQLRHLTRGTLSMQEDERRKMSRALQDEVAQRLLGINIRLMALKKGLKAGTESLKKEIGSTQRLVIESARKVKRFVHECGARRKA